MLSFSISHAFVIEDKHHNNVSEYIDEFSHSKHENIDTACDLHCEFHISYILTQRVSISLNNPITHNPFSNFKLYIYYLEENFLKPPIV
jgi:hypothetical protein